MRPVRFGPLAPEGATIIARPLQRGIAFWQWALFDDIVSPDIASDGGCRPLRITVRPKGVERMPSKMKPPGDTSPVPGLLSAQISPA